MAKTRLALDQVELIGDTNNQITQRVLEERVRNLLKKCPVIVSGQGQVMAYGNPAPWNQIYLSPKRGTEIVEVQLPKDITQGEVTKVTENRKYHIRVGRTSQELDSPCTVYMDYDPKRKILTTPIKGFVLPSNY